MQKRYKEEYNKLEIVEHAIEALQAIDELEDLGYNEKGVNFLYKKVGDGLYQIPYKDGTLMTGKEGVRQFLQFLYELTDEESENLKIE